MLIVTVSHRTALRQVLDASIIPKLFVYLNLGPFKFHGTGTNRERSCKGQSPSFTRKRAMDIFLF